MLNFNNTITSKIISLIVAVSFLMADVSYAGASSQDSLRVPMGEKGGTYKRARETIEELGKAHTAEVNISMERDMAEADSIGQLSLETPENAAQRVLGLLKETQSMFDAFLTVDLKNRRYNRSSFNPGDSPTIAARLEYGIYDLLMFHDRVKYDDASQAGVTAKERFKSELEGFGFPPPPTNRENGKSGYHFGGYTNPAESFIFYYTKAGSTYRNLAAADIRGYLTLHPKEAENIYLHFVHLTKRLIERGIDFSAKAQSPAAARNRYDNIVIYIAEYDIDRASSIIKEYCRQQDQEIFKNPRGGPWYVISAIPDSAQPGLSWAREIRDYNDRWGRIMGSTMGKQGFSWSSLVIIFMAPAVLREMAARQDKFQKETPYSDEHRKTAISYREEADRIERIMSEGGMDAIGSASGAAPAAALNRIPDKDARGSI